MNTPEEIYDWLSTVHRVKDPACLQLGDRCIVGRWENVSNWLPNGFICRSGNLAIVTFGEALTWVDAHALAKAYLER